MAVIDLYPFTNGHYEHCFTNGTFNGGLLGKVINGSAVGLFTGHADGSAAGPLTGDASYSGKAVYRNHSLPLDNTAVASSKRLKVECQSVDFFKAFASSGEAPWIG
jgi:hypothetical protein